MVDELNDEFITKRKTTKSYDENWTRKPNTLQHIKAEPVNNGLLTSDPVIVETNKDSNQNDHCQLPIDYHQIRQRALERAKLKSDEELGLKSSTPLKSLLLTPSSLNKISPVDPLFNTNSTRIPLAEIDYIDNTDDEDNANGNQQNQTKVQTKGEIVIPIIKEKQADAEDTTLSPLSTFKVKFKPRKFIFDAAYVQDSPPLSATVTQQDNEKIELSSKTTTSPTKKPNNLKMKFAKILHSNHQQPITTMTMTTPTPDTDTTNERPSSQQVKVKPGGILKSIFTKTSNRKSADWDASQVSMTMTTSDVSTTDSGFNALSVQRSPGLVRHNNNSRHHHQTTSTPGTMAKRLHNDELRLEKQQREKRLRMSQEIQRKLDEVENKITELEFEGVNLEKSVCLMDADDSDARDKMEQELYNLIHLKNLLTRVENDLTIQ